MISFNNLLNILPLLQSFFFIILFIILFKRIVSPKYLLGFMIISFLGYLGEFLTTYLYYPVSVWSYYLCIPIELLGIPVLFLYVSTLTRTNLKFKPYYLFHFLPGFIILIINIISFSSVSYDLRVKLVEGTLSYDEITKPLLFYIKAYDISQSVIYNLQLVFYSYLLIRILVKHSKHIENYFSNTEKYKLKWLSVFIILITVFSTLEIVFYFLDVKGISPEIYAFISFAYVSLIGYGASWQKEIYPKQFSSVLITEKETFNKSKVDNAEPDELIKEIAIKLQHVLEEEKQYLNSNLTIEDLATRLDIHRNLLSKAINDYYGVNFHQYINDFRINTAIELLKDSSYNQYSIEGIALNSGFNSKSVFNPTFKKKMQITPSEYRKKVQQ